MNSEIKFILGVVAGLIVTALTEHILSPISAFMTLFSPIIGGFVSGLIVGKSIVNGAISGFLQGTIFSIAISAIILLNTGLPPISFITLLGALLFGVVGSIGGVLGQLAGKPGIIK